MCKLKTFNFLGCILYNFFVNNIINRIICTISVLFIQIWELAYMRSIIWTVDDNVYILYVYV